MKQIASIARRITIIVLCCGRAWTQAQDLTPLLPPAASGAERVRSALLAGDLTGARTLASSLDPPTRDLWNGLVAIAGNDSTAAIRSLRRNGSSPKALGVAYYLARQHLLFRQQMEKAIAADPSDFGPYYYLGRHFDSDLDNPEEAARWFTQSLEHNPGYLRARSYLASCFERLGRRSEAEAAYQASASVAESQLGLARLRLGEAPSSALPFVQKALALAPRDPKAWKLAARLHTALNQRADAVAALESAAALAPHDASTHYLLYRACQASGDSRKASAALAEFERLRTIYGLQPQ